MVNFTSIKTEIYSVFSDLFNVDIDQLDDGLGPGDILSWNSVGHLRLILKIEDKYDIKLMVNEVLSINSIKDLINLVIEKRSNHSDSGAKDATGLMPTLRLPEKVYYELSSLRGLDSLQSGPVAVVTGNSEFSRITGRQISRLVPDPVIITRDDGEPTISTIVSLADEFNKKQFGAIIAVGGGSTIDAVKLANLYAGVPSGEIGEQLKKNIIPATSRLPHLVAVQTLPGSGAEVSSTALIMEDRASPKTIFLDNRLLPDVVVLDRTLAETVPFSLVITGCFDALSHAIEGFASIAKHPRAEELALTTVAEIATLMADISECGDARGYIPKLLKAAYGAGVVQNHCSVGGCHALAHASARHGISHATAITLFLPTFLRFAITMSSRYRPILHVISDISDTAAIDKLADWQNSLGFNPSMGIISAIDENRVAISETALNVTDIDTNPFSIEQDDLLAIIDNTVARWR